MPATLECHGEIEIICDTASLAPNKIARLVFRTWGEAVPPYEIKVRSPNGSVILERVLRTLPTGEPQSAPPIAFSVRKGDYEIVIAQLKGDAEGRAILSVS